MGLVTVSEARERIGALHLSDAMLQAVLDRAEAMIVERYGENYSDGLQVTERFYQSFPTLLLVFLKRRATSLVTVLADGTDVTADTRLLYDGWAVKLPQYAQEVEVTYTPEDDTEKRREAIIDLARLMVSRTAFQSESAGGVSYRAADWENEMKRILARLRPAVRF